MEETAKILIYIHAFLASIAAFIISGLGNLITWTLPTLL
jgi:hypothetical protein